MSLAKKEKEDRKNSKNLPMRPTGFASKINEKGSSSVFKKIHEKIVKDKAKK